MHRFSFKQWALLPALLFVFSTILTAQEYSIHSTPVHFSQMNPCKPFIGVGTSPVIEGLKVDYTVDNTPATKYGIQADDVILTLDGVPVHSQPELMRERDKHQQGEAFTLVILRNGLEKTINARFKACSAEELEVAKQDMESALAEKEIRMEEMHTLMQEKLKGFEMSERPILGVFENTDVNVDGLAIGTVISGKGAEAAGLQPGDVVVKVDGKPITGSGTLGKVLASHKPGDRVSVVYHRNGDPIEIQTVLSADRGYFNFKMERDPCKVFIGVYTGVNGTDGRGIRVDGVIDDTPAKTSSVQPGDIILAFNGISVNSHQALTTERDKNKPGDAFRMTVLRNGATMEIKAKFKSCDTPGKTPVEETAQVIQEDKSSEQREVPKNLDNTLNLVVFEAYPNPTFGGLNIQFEAEAVLTTVRILDVAGREVYRKDLPQFNGSFKELVNLSNNKAGNYVLSVQQGDKVQSKVIVLLPRA